MNNPNSYDFAQHAFGDYVPVYEVDGDGDEWSSYGYDQNQIEPTYEMLIYGYLDGELSSHT